ncbi:MAG TPA: SdrD B-like domain-containing protein [Chthoniobacterales bacterium]|nr:SdrD B-like domain-containing protein [Chthoniobacterales bacterium]
MKITKASWGKVIFPAIFLMAVTILLVLPFWRSTAANPTLNNANFETGPFMQQGVVTGWTSVGNTADLAQGATSGTHSAGLSAGFDSQGDSISQSFTTTSNQKYNLDFDAGIFGRRSGNPLQVRVEVIGTGNVTLVNSVITPPDAGTWTPSQVAFNHYQFPFTANGSGATVRFTSIGLGNANADQMVDTVSVTEVVNNGTVTICDASGAVADSCYTLRPFPCTSGQAFWFPNADCAIPEGNDCLNPGSDPSSGTDGFKYIFTTGPGSTVPSPAVFTEDPVAGTASLVGHLESLLHPGYGFDVNVTWSGRTNDPTGGMGALRELDPGCYKSAQNPGAPVDVSTWHFYANGSGTLTGTGNYAGAIVQLTPVMHYFQVGNGASGKNIKFGMSGWFTWTVQKQPNNPQFCIRNAAAVNRTADFNLNCENPRNRCEGTGKIGDFVWNDLNKNGCQDANEPGMANVRVDLYTGCGANREFVTSTTTDSNGMYMFSNLCAGDYSVCFHKPDGFSHTLANQSCTGGDEKDSDCECTDNTDGSVCCVCVTLPTNSSTNLTIDCGYIQNCALQVTKSCVVPSPSPTATAFDCKKMKPINELKMTWNGSQTICIKAWKGSVGSTLLSTQCNITPGTTVTVSGYAGSPNDVIWEIFNNNGGTPGTKIGESTFHVSCSDVDMDGPEDCGKAEGDGKGKTGFINQWIFAGMSGNGISINCGGGNGGGNPNSNCVVTPNQGGSGCNPETGLGKPTTLTFQYNNGSCASSNNPQSGKFVCTGSVNTALPINVSNSDGYTQSTTTVSPGGTITFTKGGSTLSSQSDFTLSNSGGTETLSIHTSCSQPLHIGDVFGNFTLVGFNGQTGGNGGTIVYHYEVKNNGASMLTNVFLTDDKLGPIAGPFSLNAGQTKTFDVQTTISQTTTNTATATVQGGNCSAQSNPVTVTVSSPTPTPMPQAACSELKPINEIRMQWNGSGTICIKAWKGSVGSTLLSTQCNITPGTLVTVSGYAGSPNDVIWEIFNNNAGTPGTKIGESTFHLSCSDSDMNGPEDCGKAAGDGKGKTGFINTWIFKGMSGNGKQISCP